MTRVTACLRSELNQRAFARDEAEVRHHTTKESASLPDHYLKQLIGTTAANSNRCIDSEPSHSTPSILSQGLPWLPAQKSMALACASSHAARLKYPHACQPAWTRSQLLSTPKRPPRQQHAHHLQPVVAGASSSDNPEVNIEQLFASELANRQAAEAKQAEVAAAAAFDGTALLALLR